MCCLKSWYLLLEQWSGFSQHTLTTDSRSILWLHISEVECRLWPSLFHQIQQRLNLPEVLHLGLRRPNGDVAFQMVFAAVSQLGRRPTSATATAIEGAVVQELINDCCRVHVLYDIPCCQSEPAHAAAYNSPVGVTQSCRHSVHIFLLHRVSLLIIQDWIRNWLTFLFETCSIGEDDSPVSIYLAGLGKMTHLSLLTLQG
jgi:hypothetical protein